MLKEGQDACFINLCRVKNNLKIIVHVSLRFKCSFAVGVRLDRVRGGRQKYKRSIDIPPISIAHIKKQHVEGRHTYCIFFIDKNICTSSYIISSHTAACFLSFLRMVMVMLYFKCLKQNISEMIIFCLFIYNVRNYK